MAAFVRMGREMGQGKGGREEDPLTDQMDACWFSNDRQEYIGWYSQSHKEHFPPRTKKTNITQKRQSRMKRGAQKGFKWWKNRKYWETEKMRGDEEMKERAQGGVKKTRTGNQNRWCWRRWKKSGRRCSYTHPSTRVCSSLLSASLSLSHAHTNARARTHARTRHLITPLPQMQGNNTF